MHKELTTAISVVQTPGLHLRGELNGGHGKLQIIESMESGSPEWFPGFEQPDEVNVRRQIELRLASGTIVWWWSQVPCSGIDPPSHR